MKKLLITLCLMIACVLTMMAQGIPYIHTYNAEDYGANDMNFDLITSDDGVVFFANFEGLLYYDNAKWRIIHTPGITRVTVVSKDSHGTIWVGGYNFFGKVKLKANGELGIERIGPPDLFHGEMLEIFEEEGHMCFIIFQKDTYKIYKVVNDKPILAKQIKGKASLMGLTDIINLDAIQKHDSVSARQDNIQEEELGNGLKAILRKGKGIIIVDKDGKELFSLTESNGLPTNNVNYIAYDGHGIIWGVTDKGIFSVEFPSVYSHFTQKEGLTGGVLSIGEFQNKIYVGTYDGLYVLDNMTFRKIPEIKYACWNLQSSPHGLLVASADGVYWLPDHSTVRRMNAVSTWSLYQEGAYIYSGNINGLHRIHITDNKQEKVADLERVTKIMKDNKGTTWVQNLYGEVWYKLQNENAFKHYAAHNTHETYATIVKYNEEVHVIGAEDKSPFPFPLFSYTDKRGVTWLTNNEGRSIYAWKNGRRLDADCQMVAPFHNTAIRAMLHRDNELWLGSANGVDIVKDIKNAPELMTIPRLFIRSIRLGTDSVLWGGFGRMPQKLADLQNGHNDLHFTFSTDYPPIQGQTLYRYRLNDGKWSAWSTSTSATLQNLQHGDYIFTVEAKDALNRMTEQVKINFYIEPPFYLRWYMYIVYVLFLLLLFYLQNKIRVYRLEKDKQQLEMTVRERTAEVVKQKDEIEEKSKSLEIALKELGETQTELIRQEKMATVGKLTQGLIDRILNPLNYINNFSKLSEGLIKDLAANIEDDKDNMDEENYEDTVDVLDMLRGNLQKVGEHGANTTRTLKAMEEILKDRSGGKTQMDLIALLRQNEEMVHTYYGNEITTLNILVTFTYDTDTIMITGNGEQLSKTFMSLLGNAIYAVRKQAVRKQEQHIAYQPEVKVGIRSKDNIVEMRIHDNGIGIEDTIIDKVFDPFFTTKTTGEASGVGLYLSKEIIQSHGGDIKVHSVKNEFSEFTITLPIK